MWFYIYQTICVYASAIQIVYWQIKLTEIFTKIMRFHENMQLQICGLLKNDTCRDTKR